MWASSQRVIQEKCLLKKIECLRLIREWGKKIVKEAEGKSVMQKWADQKWNRWVNSWYKKWGDAARNGGWKKEAEWSVTFVRERRNRKIRRRNGRSIQTRLFLLFQPPLSPSLPLISAAAGPPPLSAPASSVFLLFFITLSSQLVICLAKGQQDAARCRIVGIATGTTWIEWTLSWVSPLSTLTKLLRSLNVWNQLQRQRESAGFTKPGLKSASLFISGSEINRNKTVKLAYFW